MPSPFHIHYVLFRVKTLFSIKLYNANDLLTSIFFRVMLCIHLYGYIEMYIIMNDTLRIEEACSL